MNPVAAKYLAGLLLVLALGAGVTGALLSRRHAPQFEATTAVRVVRDQTDLEQLGNRAPTGLDTVVFLQNEAELILSDAVLQKVSARLELDRKWGQRYNAGGVLKAWETTALLKARLQVSPEPGTTQLRLQAASDEGPEAMQLADALAAAYCEYRVERRHRIAQSTIDALALPYRENEAKVNQASARAEQARRELEAAGADPAPAPTNQAPAAGHDLRGELTRATMNYLVQSNQLARSRSLPAAELEKLEAQVELTRVALTNAETAVRIEARKQEVARAYQNARQELEAAQRVFAPIQAVVEEKRRELAASENPPALIVAPAGPAIARPANHVAAQACLVGAAGLLVAAGGLLVRSRKPAVKS